MLTPMRALRDALVVPPTPEPDPDAEVTEEHESLPEDAAQELGRRFTEGRVQSALLPQAPAVAKKGPLQQACSQAANSLAGQAQQQSDVRRIQPLHQNLQETKVPNLRCDRQQGGGKPCNSPRQAKENATVPKQSTGEAIKPAGPIPQRKKSRKTTGGRTLPLQYDPTQPQPKNSIFSIAQGTWITAAPTAGPSAAPTAAPLAAPAPARGNDQHSAPSKVTSGLDQSAAEPASSTGHAASQPAPCPVPAARTTRARSRQQTAAAAATVRVSAVPGKTDGALASSQPLSNAGATDQRPANGKQCAGRPRMQCLPTIEENPGERACLCYSSASSDNRCDLLEQHHKGQVAVLKSVSL